jgi:hypothetical protein
VELDEVLVEKKSDDSGNKKNLLEEKENEGATRRA